MTHLTVSYFLQNAKKNTIYHWIYYSYSLHSHDLSLLGLSLQT